MNNISFCALSSNLHLVDTIILLTRLIKWIYYTYDLLRNITGPEGMEKFCEDLGVDPENVVMLVIAYKMGAKQMGFFTQEEWVKGMICFDDKDSNSLWMLQT